MDDPININKDREYLLAGEEYPTEEEISKNKENNENKIELQVTEETPLPPPPPLPLIDPVQIQQNPNLESLAITPISSVQTELPLDYANNPNIVPSNQPVILINPEKPYYETENKENNNIIQNQNENSNNREPEDKRCCCTRCCCCICGCIGDCISGCCKCTGEFICSCCKCIDDCLTCQCCDEECSNNAECFCDGLLAILQCLALIFQICAAFK